MSRPRVNAALSRLDRRLLYVRRPRRAVILALERLRVKLAPSRRARVEFVQSLFFNDRYRRAFFDPEGRRRSILEFADLFEVGPPALKGATILAPGAEWNTKDPDRIRRLKERDGFRLVMICYDMIPILFPQFYLPRDRDVFVNYFRNAIGFVDKFVCISECTARDVIRFAAEQGGACETSVQLLGSDLLEAGDAPLPDALKARRYALFVSTIEPRKNHALLHRIWRRLLDAGIPQRHDFQLVFVGRPGWSTDALVRQFAEDTRGECNFQYLSNAGDGLLRRLYRDAAFCLYPSLYEGFGLPVIEAFAHGRAVIASNAGSIPEVVDDLSPIARSWRRGGLAPDDAAMDRGSVGRRVLRSQDRGTVRAPAMVRGGAAIPGGGRDRAPLIGGFGPGHWLRSGRTKNTRFLNGLWGYPQGWRMSAACLKETRSSPADGRYWRAGAGFPGRAMLGSDTNRVGR